ncbi:MAG: patatin-like phospholipase family protein [Moraxella sp.]|nr:patatin-like phospholipase family protein [Moraxella sp.]
MRLLCGFALPITTASFAMLLTACATTTSPTSNTTTTPKKPVVALVLGGGVAKGFAHIGVIKALEAHGIHPDMVVGSSAGAMVGALYASGKNAHEMMALADTLDERALIDFTPSNQGLLEGKKLRQYIHTHTGGLPIERLPIRFVAVATDANTGQAVAFDKGDTGLVVQASASIPKIFIAPRIPEPRGKKYIDGGQSALVPSHLAKTLGADVVIAVDVLADKRTAQVPHANTTPKTLDITQDGTQMTVRFGDLSKSIPIHQTTLPFDVSGIFSQLPKQAQIALPSAMVDFISNPASIWQTLETYQARITPADIAASDVLITPKLGHLSVIDTAARDEMITLGEEATLAKITDIKAAIDTAKPNHTTP